MTHFFWDTNLFIYQWDSNSPFQPSVLALRRKMLAAGIGLVTSSMTRGELMAGPRRAGMEMIALQYKAALSQSATIVPFDDRAADLYATIRAQTRVKQPDGIQLACAGAHGVQLFVTDDDQLWPLRVPGVHFIVSIETALSLVP
ncbi:MAG: PIN domain-containing protein [Acidobacteriaceae bacterium]